MTTGEYSIYLIAMSSVAVRRQQLEDKMARQRAKGKESPSWKYEADRIDSIEDQLARQVVQYSPAANTEEQKEIVELARHVVALKRVNVDQGSFSGSVNHHTVSACVKVLTGTSHTFELLKQVPEDLRALVQNHIVFSVIFGTGIPQVALMLYKRTGLDRDLCARIITSGTMETYRHGNLLSQASNSDVVKGWRWSAAHQVLQTCPKCIAMDGTFHANNDPFESHEGCRCVPVPVTKSSSEILGNPSNIPEPTTDENAGWIWFDKLSEAEQLYMVEEENLKRIRELKASGDKNPLRTIYVNS